MLLNLLFHGGRIGLSNIEEIPVVNKIRELTDQSVDQKILTYFEEYKKFFLNAINHRA